MATVTRDNDTILTINSGSSSLKFAAFDVLPGSNAIVAGQVDGVQDDAAFDVIEEKLAAVDAPAPSAIGHRIVHGGPRLYRHCRIDPRILKELEDAIPFAPLHAPGSLALIRFALVRYPGVPQFACFDTVFHHDMPDLARVLPIPKTMLAQGLRRYGFHGLSCESIVRQLGEDCPDRLIVAHLGNGASVTAIRDGRSVDTSMGLTPSGGVIMGSRGGDLDPGILIHLMRTKHWDAEQIEQMIDRQSGMIGISGLSGDIRRLHDAASANPDADLAVRMFCRSAAKQIAAMMTTLGGADAIVFTGGIGEHDEAVRAAICGELAWASVTDGTTASANIGDARCRAFSLPSREEEQIALHVRELLAEAIR